MNRSGYFTVCFGSRIGINKKVQLIFLKLHEYVYLKKILWCCECCYCDVKVNAGTFVSMGQIFNIATCDHGNKNGNTVVKTQSKSKQSVAIPNNP